MMILNIPGIKANTQFLANSPSTDFLGKRFNFKKVHYISDEQSANVVDKYLRGNSGLFFMAAQHAFMHHRSFVLNPAVIWYVISAEISTHVKQNEEKYRHLFTDSSEKKLIEIVDNSLVYGGTNNWSSVFSGFYGQLAKNINTDINLFVPSFSCSTMTTTIATLVSFMDCVSKYYNYSIMTMCGIPSFKIEGVKEDWELIVKNLNKLGALMPNLNNWFEALNNIIQKIIESYSVTDHSFWNSFFKVSGASGTDDVDGWITVLTAHLPTEGGMVLRKEFNYLTNGWGGVFPRKDFSSTLSSVDCNWSYYGKQIPLKLISGVLSVKYENGFISPQLGVAILE